MTRRKHLKPLFFMLLGVLSTCGGKHAPTPGSQSSDRSRSGEEHENSPPTLDSNALTFASIQSQILRPHCMECHSTAGRTGGKRIPFDRYEEMMTSDRGLIVPGSPEKSAIIISATLNDEDRMPPPNSNIPPFSPADLEALRDWIRKGAPKQ